MIKLLRVDKRLLHGQVAFTWTSSLGADCILIACDTLQNDPLRLTTIKLSKPSGAKLVIKNVKESIAAINEGKTDKYVLFIVVECIKDAYRLLKGCPDIGGVSLGYTDAREACEKLANSIFATEEEVGLLRELIQDGKDVTIQTVPTAKATSVKKML